MRFSFIVISTTITAAAVAQSTSPLMTSTVAGATTTAMVGAVTTKTKTMTTAAAMSTKTGMTMATGTKVNGTMPTKATMTMPTAAMPTNMNMTTPTGGMPATTTGNMQTLAILNFALTLEHLEAAFYKWGLAKFSSSDYDSSGYSSAIRQNFMDIANQEATHVQTLTTVIKALGGTPVPACKYTFPVKNVHDFFLVARALEVTGVSAYLGQVAGLNGNILTAAATITTVEARHSTFLNELLGGAASIYPFDAPLTAREVVTIAINFIKSCPFQLGITPFTQLKLTFNSGSSSTSKSSEHLKKSDSNSDNPSSMTDPSVMEGSDPRTIKVSYKGMVTHLKTLNLFCQFIFSNTVTVAPLNKCNLPKAATGYVYVLVTATSKPLIAMDEANILAGPALVFAGKTK